MPRSNKMAELLLQGDEPISVAERVQRWELA